MSITLSPLGAIPKYAKNITPPDVRVALPWYSLFLGALLKPLDVWIVAYWTKLYGLVQSQKGRNPNRLFIEYELNRVFNTTGFKVLFNDVYIADTYIGFFTDGGPDEYDGFFTEEPSTNLNFEGFQYEYKTNPLGFVIAPDGFTYPISDPYNAIAAVVDGLRIPCQLYQITVNGTTQNRPI